METLRPTLLVFLLALANFASATERAPLFQDDTVIKAVLTAPIAQAYSQREQDVRIYLPGHWTFTNSDGESQRLDVSIRTRGNFRRVFCNLPPLQLNFKKSQVKGTDFRKQNKLKLVAPCKHGPKDQQNVLMEYLAYRIFEILTDRSFGTRLIRLSYIDSDEKMRPWTDLVFVIEDDGDVAKRLEFEKLHVAYNEVGQLDQTTTALVELFQLLISNNDYSVLNGPAGVSCCHNIEMFVDKNDVGKRIPVPFDFDMSGLVFADYASPPEHLPTKSVRTRHYRGLCQPPAVIDQAVAHIRSKRDEIMSLFYDTPELSRLSKSQGTTFINRFFKLLENDEKFNEKVVFRCRGLDQPESESDSEQ